LVKVLKRKHSLEESIEGGKTVRLSEQGDGSFYALSEPSGLMQDGEKE